MTAKQIVDRMIARQRVIQPAPVPEKQRVIIVSTGWKQHVWKGTRGKYR